MESLLPYPALCASHAGVWQAGRAMAGMLDLGGPEVVALSPAEALRALKATPHLLVNAPLVAAHLGVEEVSGLDLLELFVFVHPATFVVPSVGGLATFLGMALPEGGEEAALALPAMAESLLDEMANPGWKARPGARASLTRLTRLNWGWSAVVAKALAKALGEGRGRPFPETQPAGLFQALPEWEEAPPRPPAHPALLSEDEVSFTLAQLAGKERPPRPAQETLAAEMLFAFEPQESDDGPNMVVAEAGTGIGKTLSYLAPASLYAGKTGGTVWLSTFTRALQRQLKAETERSLPGLVRRGQVVVRKGRENYLCLLNLEDALEGGFRGRAAIFAALVARWARYTCDGDMVGGDLPGWLPGLFRRGAAPALTDRRGECIHAACPHYRRCFIEKSVRDARRAALVIANHALVLAYAGHAEREDFSRLVFDEGHHLQAAADNAFSVVFSGAEALELRRWLLGPGQQGRRAGRRRGLAARLTEITAADAGAHEALTDLLAAAQMLPARGWLQRLTSPVGPFEEFFARIRQAILARAEGQGEGARGYTLELSLLEPVAGLPEVAGRAAKALKALGRAMARLEERLAAIEEEAPDWLDPYAEARAAAARQGLARRLEQLAAWQRLALQAGGRRKEAGVDEEGADEEGAEKFVRWMQLVRAEGHEVDCGIWQHWLDPLKPLAGEVLAPADGVIVTSATLGRQPEAAAGARYLAVAPHVVKMESPFPYAENTRIFIVTDVTPRRAGSAALAYAQLIEAAGGGTLGLFTAIARLRAVHARVAARLARAGLPLFAQHVDHMDTGTLVDLFRADPKASLFGTDALRDGVDVPGESLRLIVFEGVPWSRPTLLHSARRLAFGGAPYEERLVRGRLQQAFGRLVRRAEDRGCFVLLGPAVPSRLLDAFPAGVPVRRAPLAEVAQEVHAFLADGQAASL